MALIDQFKKDMYLLIDGVIHHVTERRLKTQGRQGGLVILKMRNLQNGNIVEKTIKAGTKLEQIEPELSEVQYLYSDDDYCYVMNTVTFDTIAVAKTVFGDYIKFLKEGDKNLVMIYEGEIINIRTNPTVKLTVTEASNAVKGNTATAATKTVVTETGYKVNVPLFVNQGDTIIVNTETGEYTGRA